MAREERYGTRHDGLTARHRAWGDDCPATDLDLLLIEYDQRKAVAIIDYKEGFDRPLTVSEKASLAAQRDLADRAGLPFFIVRYRLADWTFVIAAENERARLAVNEAWLGVRVSERNYVRFLYHLRGRPVPDIILAGLSRAA